ncbi:gliding motility-associated C-terminal domain-containing protein, partial [Flavobacterium sp. LMO9]
YSWAPSGGTAATASGLSAGTYTVTVTDANSCTATQSFTITEPTALVVTPASQTNVSCNSGSNGSATVTVSGGTAGYTYSWAPPGGTAATASGLSAGTYIVTVTDANSCTATQSFTITEPTALIASIGSTTDVSCVGSSDGSATVSVTGGTAGYTYSWAPSGGSNATATGLMDGIYVVTVTDVNGCTTTQSFTIGTIVDVTNPTISAPAAINTTTNSGCTATGVTLGTPITADNCTVASVTNNAPLAFPIGNTTVTWTVTDGLGNTATATQVVTVQDTTLPTVITQPLTVTLDASGEASITASQIDNGSTDNCTIASITIDIENFNCDNLGANTVTLTVTDIYGNIATQTAIVTVISTDGDNDNDGIKDNCDDDDDNDGVIDIDDNCPLTYNPDQADNDNDGFGDVCDDDDDNDGIDDVDDNCQLTYNPYQEDRDNDGLGDVCDTIEINVAEAITPNGDGINDTWMIYNIENHPNNYIRVFNRWGDLVFEARNYQNDWDGHFKSKSESLPDGASYYYQIDLDGNGTIEHDGWIYITR